MILNVANLSSTSGGTCMPNHLMKVMVLLRPQGAKVRITFLGNFPIIGMQI